MNCRIPKEEVKANGNLQMNLYDLNKQIISQMPALDEEGVERALMTVMAYIKNTENKFYMLLCRDINYYTLFNISTNITEPYACEEVLACAKDLGAVKSVEVNDNNAIEIWVQGEDDEARVMYLFPYDGGVIECTV